jgi:hypothetical protein
VAAVILGISSSSDTETQFNGLQRVYDVDDFQGVEGPNKYSRTKYSGKVLAEYDSLTLMIKNKIFNVK